MFKAIGTFLGPYVYHGWSLVTTYLMSFFAVTMFARRLPRRDNFPVRLLIVLLEGIAICYLLAIWYTETNTLFVRVLCYMAVTHLNLIELVFCWIERAEEILLTFCSGIATHWFTAKLLPLVQDICGINSNSTISFFHDSDIPAADWEYLLFYSLQLGTMFLLSILFVPKTRLARSRRITRQVGALSVATIVLVNILICVSRSYEAESYMLSMVTRCLYSVLCLAVLFSCSGIFSQSEQEQQIDILHQLWRQDRAQFESIKANMDVINMKCHDLKHILGQIEGKLTCEEAASLREAIQFYDANIKTGNEVLDVVLCEKAMTCQKNGVAFSCMADGKGLGFLTPVQTYSLFGNIIDNAIEAVKPLPPENRVISLTCHEEGEALVIEESNYFSGALALENGLPVTGKEDASRHGFGTRSIQFIAAQYGGVMNIKVVDNMFFLTVRFPAKACSAQA